MHGDGREADALDPVGAVMDPRRTAVLQALREVGVPRSEVQERKGRNRDGHLGEGEGEGEG